jgi:SepF-like predicted cell division protein (DUF552 family)
MARAVLLAVVVVVVEVLPELQQPAVQEARTLAETVGGSVAVVEEETILVITAEQEDWEHAD